jgi:hypothetical protein
MELFRLFLIFLIIIIFAYVLHKLLKQRYYILKKNSPLQEGLDNIDITNLQKNGTPIAIQNMNPKYKNMPLREYCIKASYNTAYTGKNIDSKMVKYVLGKGCRFIDLQLHYSEKDGIVYVANITDFNSKEMESNNRVPLDTIFNVIAANAFSNIQSDMGCPNPKDPLFIHLRVIPDMGNNIYDLIVACINKNFSKNVLLLNNNDDSVRIDKYTQMNDKIMGKALFLIDKTYNPEYATLNQSFARMMNGETGGNTFQVLDYSKIKNMTKTPPTVKDDFKTTNIVEEKIVMPEILERYDSPSIINMVVNHGVQITLYSFYKQNDQLMQYEELFNNYKSGIIPIAYVIHYLDNLEKDLANNMLILGPL